MHSERLNFLLPDRVLEFRVRNENFWARLRNGRLIYVSLARHSVVETCRQIDSCEFFSVSPKGDFCFVRNGTRNYIICAKDLQLKEASLVPRATVLWVDWVTIPNRDKPLIFFAIEAPVKGSLRAQQIVWYDLSQPRLLACSVLPPQVDFKLKISAIHFYRLPLFHGLALISTEVIAPYLLGDDFLPVKPRGQEIRLPPGLQMVFCEEAFLGILCPPHIFVLAVDVNLTTPIPLKFLDRQYLIESEDAVSISVANNFLFRFHKDRLDVIDLNYNDQEIAESFVIGQSDAMDMDLVCSELYSISGLSVTRHRFTDGQCRDPSDGLRHFFYRKFIKQKEYGLAIQHILQTHLTWQEILALTRKESAELKLLFFIEILKPREGPPVNLDFRQRTALAIYALDLYVRIESFKPSKDVQAFVEWVRPLIAEGFLNENVVRQTLEQYSWTEPLRELLRPPGLFEVCMIHGDSDAALVCLETVDVFIAKALRLLRSRPRAVVAQLQAHNLQAYPAVIPILLCPEADDMIEGFFRQADPSPWLRDLFCLWLAKVAPDAILHFFRNPRLTTPEVSFITRCLIATGRYRDLAFGLAARRDYFWAAGAAARCGADATLDFLPPDITDDLRVQCTLRLLKSMRPSDAEIVAERLLKAHQYLEIGALLGYLPVRTKVSDLASALSAYATNKKRIDSVQKAALDRALAGITHADQLKSEAEDQGITFNAHRICLKCGRLIFTEPFIVWPCGHILHEKCVITFIQKAGLDARDPAKSCPLCGPICVTLIDRPFDVPKDDSWSIDLGGGGIVSALANLL
jgi:hypothetical protein